MTWQDVVILALVLVDVAALSIGISIRRRVTRIIESAGAAVEATVRDGIAAALARLSSFAADVLRAQGRPDAADRILEELGAGPHSKGL